MTDNAEHSLLGSQPAFFKFWQTDRLAGSSTHEGETWAARPDLDCRIPIDEIAGFFRRDNFDSSGLLTRRRLQGLDLGYDLRTLAFQRSEPRHEFGNSDVRSHHRRVWRVPAFFVSSLTNSTALGAASVRSRSN
jgi:hypothetical protein